MSNWINRTLAATMLTAALGSTAEAGNYREQMQQQQNNLFDACYTVGQQKGVAPLPLTGKAFQQDRDTGVGCTFATAAGNEFIVEKAFDLRTQRGAQGYTQAITSLQKAETAEGNRLMNQANRGQPRRSGNVLVDGLNDLDQLLRGTNRVINSTGQNATSIKNGSRAFGN